MAQANPLAAFQQGFGNAIEQGQAVQQMGRRNALYDVYDRHGQGIAQGDPQALSALAGVDPMAAYDLRRQQASDQRSQSRYDMEMAQIAQSLSAEEAAAERQQLQRAVQIASAAQSPEEWDALAQQYGAEQLVGQFDNRDAVVRGLMTFDQFLEERTGPEEPASVHALRVRASEAGLEPGTEAYQEFMRRGGSIPQGMSIEATPDGGMRFVQGEGVGGGEGVEFTQQQSKDNVYATRARGALEAFEPVANAMADRGDRILDMLPFGVGREAQGDEFQVAQQAGTEFLQAILRKDTGAAITEDEVDSYGRVYLPRPGDSEAVLETKRQARIRAINALESGMTPAQMLARDRALVASAQESAEGTERGRLSNADAPTSASPAPERNQPPRPFNDMTFEQFAQDPSVKAAAERYGVTLREMWNAREAQ